MNMTIWDLGVWAAAFTGAWLILPMAWQHVLETAVAAAEGFGRERMDLGARIILAGIALVGIVAGLSVYGLTRSLLLASLALGAGLAAPGWALSSYQNCRRRRFHQQFMNVLLMIANSLRAGFNLSQAVDIVAREMPAPARDEFARVVRDRDLGMSIDEGLERLAVRMNGESVRIFVTAIQVGRQTGGDLTRILDGLVRMIRERERVEDRVQTMTSETRFQGYTLAGLPYLLLVGWLCLDPAGVRDIFSTVWGKALLAVGTTFNALALMTIRKMASVKI
ncbi:MAG: type II secretion system F family protein [Kiritimatiellia bacterium]